MFTFDEKTHTYYLDGVKIPSVSEIIAPLYDFSSVSPAKLENAAHYGKAVHKTIELFLSGTIDHDKLDDKLKQPLEEFKGFIANEVINGNIISVETKCYSNKLKFAGTIDLITDMGIIDIKTRKYSPKTDDLQLTAYSILSGLNKPLYVLELLPDKPYNLVKVVNRQAKSMFLYMLDYWHKTNKFNLKLKEWKNEKI